MGFYLIFKYYSVWLSPRSSGPDLQRLLSFLVFAGIYPQLSVLGSVVGNGLKWRGRSVGFDTGFDCLWWGVPWGFGLDFFLWSILLVFLLYGRNG